MPFQVYNAIGNWPYVVHILTNYGIYILDFDFDLTDQSQYVGDTDKLLTPLNTRIVRFFFDKYDYNIAYNDWGYIFIVRKYTTSLSFDIYLAVVSFFSE